MKTQFTNHPFRNEKIGNFYKTEHFLLRQWERKVSDEILELSLAGLKCEITNLIIIVSRKIIKNHQDVNAELFILVDKKSLKTCFFEKIEIFQSRNNKISNYKIVSK